MALKTKGTIFFCTACGHEDVSYLGKCAACGEWGTYKEAKFDKAGRAKGTKKASASQSRELFVRAETELVKLQDIKEDEITRLDTKSAEMNRVLGGGIVPGSLTLIGGEPGIGKSTILLQIANNFSQQKQKVIYVSAEESSKQLKLRANRLKVSGEEINVFAENNLNSIIDLIETKEPQLVIIDSIQAVYLENLDSIPGSPSQIRECTGHLMRLAKAFNIPIFIVGHINKDGDIAGPKILEHMVDTVLQFEGSQDSNIRFLRSIKNRFGSTNEISVFAMEHDGLHDITNPSEIFLDQKSDGVIVASKEGRRTILIELQAIALGSEYSNPRRVANGVGLARLHQILAILEKRAKVSLAKADIYLNVVGGLHIKEPAADLGIALAIYKSVAEKEIPADDFIAIGELGLAGEVRSVTDCQSRIKEAIKLGFNKIIAPEVNLKKIDMKELLQGTKAKVIGIKNIGQAINQLN